MQSISVSWTHAVDALEVHFALDAVQRMVGRLQEIGFHKGWLQAAPVVNVFGEWYIPSLPEGAPYRSYQWYIDQSYDAQSESIVGSKLLATILNEPWQRTGPHYDLSFVGHRFDSAAEGAQDEQSVSLLVPGRVAVISVAPLRALTDERERLLALRRVAAHELGHLFGVPKPGSSHAQPAVAGRHCSNVCAMREARDLANAIQLMTAELRAGVLLCEACWRDLLCIMLDSHLGVN